MTKTSGKQAASQEKISRLKLTSGVFSVHSVPAGDAEEVAMPCKILLFIFLSFGPSEMLGLDS